MHPLSISVTTLDPIDLETPLKLLARLWGTDFVGAAVDVSDRTEKVTGNEGGPSTYKGLVSTLRERCLARVQPPAPATTPVGVVPKNGGLAGYNSDSSINMDQRSIIEQSSLVAEAVCIARIAHGDAVPLDEARARFAAIMGPTKFPTETVRIYVGFDPTREATQDEWGVVANEQALFSEAVLQGPFHCRISLPSSPTSLQIASEVVKALHAFLPSSLQELFPQPFANVKAIVAFGGLSKSGKSTIATSLVSRHNLRSSKDPSTLDLGRSGGARRLKVGYFEEQASAKLGRSVYDLADEDRALEVIRALEAYTRWHNFLEIVTLESMHSSGLSRQLQRFLGGGGLIFPRPTTTHRGRFVLVYIKTPLALRIARTTAQEGAGWDASKDVVKRARGAHELEEFADVVCTNEGTLDSTCEEIERVVGRLLDPQSA